MSKEMKFDIKSIASKFNVYGDFVSAAPYGSGHINDTIAANYSQAGKPVRYILQRVNHNVFKNVPALMENVERVTKHQQDILRAAGDTDASRKALTLVPTRDGKSFVQDAEGNFWRTYLFIEGASSHDVIKTEEQAEKASRGFGLFQKQVSTMKGARLNDTIPDFHNTPVRYGHLEEAIARDAVNRCASAKAEIDFCLSCKSWVSRLVDLNKEIGRAHV